ncbi:MAG: LytTR family DNA-binding domain-containing protein [Dysgonomonas sp.]|nr:LytTR family DNA-binding domain-containing protein [Dysgonomonas sp.]
MNKLWEYLNQPFPVIRKRGLIVILPSIIIIVLLALFKPFGLESGIDIPYKIAGFGLITACTTFTILYVAPLIFRNFYEKEKWTLAKHLATCTIILIGISTGNYLFYLSTTTFHINSYQTNFSFWLLVTLVTGAIPIIIITYILKNEELKINISEINHLNLRLQSIATTRGNTYKESGREITIEGSTSKSVNLVPENILYIEAAKNYIQINYLNDNSELKKAQLRATIGQIESQLETYEDIIRCHRAFIVNTLHIAEVQKHPSGISLLINHTEDCIPVSRTYTKATKAKLENSI